MGTDTMPAKKTTVPAKKPAAKKKAASTASKAAKSTKAEEIPHPGQVALNAKLAAEKAEEDSKRAAEVDLSARCSGKEWRVSMKEMPQALQKAESEGKTPLVLDGTASHAVDTFYSYQLAQVIEGKKLVMQGRDAQGLAEVMEEARSLMVRAVERGYTLYLRYSRVSIWMAGLGFAWQNTVPLE